MLFHFRRDKTTLNLNLKSTVKSPLQNQVQLKGRKEYIQKSTERTEICDITNLANQFKGPEPGTATNIIS